MVEDRGGLGFKFQQKRRKSRDGNRTREKLEKLAQFSKVVWNFLSEKRWWVMLSTGLSLIFLSVRIKNIIFPYLCISSGILVDCSLSTVPRLFFHSWRRWFCSSRNAWGEKAEGREGDGLDVASILREGGKALAASRHHPPLGRASASPPSPARAVPPSLPRHRLPLLLLGRCGNLQTSSISDKAQPHPRPPWSLHHSHTGSLPNTVQKKPRLDLIKYLPIVCSVVWDDPRPRHRGWRMGRSCWSTKVLSSPSFRSSPSPS